MQKKLFIDSPAVSHVVFYPRNMPIPSNLNQDIKALKLQINEEILIGGYFFLNKSEFPTILLFHGNGEIALEYQYLTSLFFECGVNLAVVDFRGYGHSSGEPTYSSLLSDAFPIYQKFKRWIDDEGLKNSLFVQGRSLGSACASEIGAQNPEDLRGVIFESGFASVYNMMTRLFGVKGPGITPEHLSKYSNDSRVKQFKKPVLAIHGTMDWIIPPSEGKLLFDSVPKNIEKKLIMIEGAGHNDIFSFNEEYVSALKTFIQKFK
jgi:hypothetical protein